MSIPVAAKAAQTFLGPRGMAFLSIALMTSALGAMNGSILSSARVPFAMAQEGIFFKKLAYIHPRSHSPVVSVAIQGAWAAVLAASGTFDQLTDCVVFASCGFFALCAAGVFIFRVKLRTAPRSYRVPGYPIVPLFFIVFSTALLVNAFVTIPLESGVGLAVTCLGIPVYLVFFKKQKAKV